MRWDLKSCLIWNAQLSSSLLQSHFAAMFFICLISGTTIITRMNPHCPAISSCSSRYVFVQELYSIYIYTLKGKNVESMNMKHFYPGKIIPVMFMKPQHNSSLVIIAKTSDTALTYIDLYKVDIIFNKFSPYCIHIL